MSRYFFTSFILLLLLIAPAIAWTPPGDINLGNVLSIFNAKNVTTTDLSVSGHAKLNNSPICTAANGECGTSTGDISSVTVGNGLTGGGTTGDLVINLSATVCSTGEYSTFNGTNFICAVDSGGTGNGGNISAVTASSGYISKFTNSTNLNNSLIYDNGSAIGINVLPTRATLDVAGNITVRLGANQIASFHDNSNASALSTIGISLIGTGGNGYVVSAGSASKSLILGTGGSLSAISVGTERVRINGTTGYVGINTTVPANTLDVVGTVKLDTGMANGTSMRVVSQQSDFKGNGVAISFTNQNNQIYKIGQPTIGDTFSIANNTLGIGAPSIVVFPNGSVAIKAFSAATDLYINGSSSHVGNASFLSNVSVSGNLSVAQTLLVNGTSQFTDNITARLYSGNRIFVDGDNLPSTGTQTNYPFSVDTVAIGADANYGYVQNFNSKPLFINPAGNNLVVGSTNSKTGFNTTSMDSTVQIVGTLGVNSSVNGGGVNLTNTYAGRGVTLRVTRPGVGGLIFSTAGGTPSSAQIGSETGGGVQNTPINIYTATSGDYKAGDLTFGGGGGTTQPTVFVGLTPNNVGINTSSPNASLQVVGTVQTTQLIVDQNLTVSGGMSTPGLCLNGDCRTSWPTGSGGVDYWQNITDLQNSNTSTNTRIDTLNSTKGNVSSTNGTSGYLARFTSGVNVATGSIYDSGSTVGIATTGSIYPLTISSTSASQPLLYLERQGVGGLLIKGTGGTPNALSFTANGTSAVDSMFIVTAAGNGFELGDVAFASRNTTPALMVDVSTNRVGILKATPDYPLDVNGTVKINGDTFVQDSELNWTSRAQLNVVDSAGNPVLAIIRSNTSYMTIGAPGGTPFGTRFNARTTGAMSILDGGLTGSTYSLGDIMMGPDVLRPVLFIDADKGSVCVGCNISEANFTVIGNSSFNGSTYHFGVVQGIDGLPASPTYGFVNETNTGMYRAATQTIGFSSNGQAKLYITGSYLRGASNDLYSITNSLARSATTPTYSWRNDEDTGLGSNGADNVSITTAGVERVRFNGTGYVQVGGGNVTISPDGNITMNGSLTVPTICLNGNCTSTWPGGSGSTFDPSGLYVNVTDLQNSNTSTNTRISTINSSYQTADGVINTTISSVVANVTALQTVRDGVYSNVTTLQTNSGAYYQNITDLQNSNSSTNTRITTINSSYQTADGVINTTISAVVVNVTALQSVRDANYVNVTALQANSGAYYQNITDLQNSNASTNTRITSINSTLSEIRINVTDLQNSNSSIKTRIDTLNTTIQNLLSSNTSIYTRIDTVNTTTQNLLTSNTTIFGLILQLGQNDTNLNSSINAVNARVTTMNSSIDGLYANVTVLQAGGSSPYYYTNITDLQNSNSSTNTRINTVNTTTVNLQTSNTTLFGLVLQLGQNDTNLNTSIQNLITSNSTVFGLILQLGQNDTNLNASINAVNTRATTINNSLVLAEQNITDLQNSNASIKTRIDTVNTTVQNLLSSNTSIYTRIDTINTTVQNLLSSNTSINTRADSINTSITTLSTFAQTKVATGYSGDCPTGIAGFTLNNGTAPNKTCAPAQSGGGSGMTEFGISSGGTNRTMLNSSTFNLYGSGVSINVSGSGNNVGATITVSAGGGNVSGGSVNGTLGFVGIWNGTQTITNSSLYVNPSTGNVIVNGIVNATLYAATTGSGAAPMFTSNSDSDSGMNIESDGSVAFYDDSVQTLLCNADGCQFAGGSSVFPGLKLGSDEQGVYGGTDMIGITVKGNSGGGQIANFTINGIGIPGVINQGVLTTASMGAGTNESVKIAAVNIGLISERISQGANDSYFLQPDMSFNPAWWWTPGAATSTTAPAQYGISTALATTGTVANVNNAWSGAMWGTSAATGYKAQGYISKGVADYYRLTGFTCKFNFYLPDATYGTGSTGQNIFVGLTSGTNASSPAWAENYTTGSGNSVGFLYNTNATNGYGSNFNAFTTNGSTSRNADTGITLTARNGYKGQIYCPQGGSSCSLWLKNVNSSAEYSGTLTANLPALTTALRPSLAIVQKQATARNIQSTGMMCQSFVWS